MRGKRVLIVDDERALQFLVQAILTGEGPEWSSRLWGREYRVSPESTSAIHGESWSPTERSQSTS